MKKFYVILAAAAAVLAVSCNKFEYENAPESIKSRAGERVAMTFTAEAADASTDVKTSLRGKSVLWSEGDAIAVTTSESTTISKFTLSSGAGQKNGVFSGTATESAKYYALYPYANATCSAVGKFGSKLSNGYGTMTEGTFPNSGNVSYAVSTTHAMTFQNLCSVFKITVPDNLVSKLKKVWISSTSEKITGEYTVDLTGETPVVSVATSGSTLVYLGYDNSGISNLKAGSYYFPVLPISLSNGIYLKLKFSDGTNTYYSYYGCGGPLALKSNTIYNLGTITDSDELSITSFENESIPSVISTGLGSEIVSNADLTGETGHAMRAYAKGTGSAKGSVAISLNNDTGKRLFSTKIRPGYETLKIRMFLGQNAFYPYLSITAGGKTYNRIPTKVNGVDFSAYCKASLSDAEKASLKTLWESTINTEAYNELEYNLNTIGNTNCGTVGYFTLNTMTNINCEASSVTKGDSVYIDNIRFGLSSTYRNNSKL